MNILEPEPERCFSQSNFRKISTTLAKVFNKLSDLDSKNANGKILKFRKNKEIDDDKSKEDIYSEKEKKIVREIMTSRKDTFILSIEDDIDSILDSLANTNHTKIPVYEKNIDNIIGILDVGDLFVKLKEKEINNIDLRKLLSKPKYLPETKSINELYDSIRFQNENLFILVDEYGGFSGIVTMDDLTNELKCLTDKIDLNNSKITKIDENNFIVKGFFSIRDFNKVFGMDIKQGNYDTLNGYIIDTLGQIPNENENIEINLGDLILKSLKVSKRRIEDIQVSIAN